MHMIEKEAATKWCPHARAPLMVAHTSDLAIGCNLDVSGTGIKCMASSCMQWRWYDTEFETFTSAHDPGEGWKNVGVTGFHTSTADTGEPSKPVQVWRRPRGDARTGYCGLAGMPTATTT